MLGETKNQFSLTRVALSTCGRAKNQIPISISFIHNNGQASDLYHNGLYVSSESGTNDLNMASAWNIQTNGSPA